jgi:hypothetical protein
MKLDDAVHAIKTIQKATASTTFFVPGLGLFGAGVAVGAGLGVLLAPRSGVETRKALREGVGRQMRAVRARFSKPRVEVVSVSEAAPEAESGGNGHEPAGHRAKGMA